MTIFTITPGNSIRTTADNTHAFQTDTAGPDTLIVEQGAYLLTDGAFSRGAWLTHAKPWKVSVAGDISSRESEGLTLTSGNTGYALRIWDATTGEVLKTLAGHENVPYWCEFSPDDRLIVSAG